LQPGVVANGLASLWLTRVVPGSGLSELARSSASPEELVERLFLRCLSRVPTAAERQPLVDVLSEGFGERLLPADARAPATPLEVLPTVTWSNHLRPESTTITLELERRVRAGPPADPTFRPDWREAYEDVVWSVINLGEMVWMP
jgi:hypothetical protein